MLAKKTLLSEGQISRAYKTLLYGFSPLISKSYYLQLANKQTGKVTQSHTTYFFFLIISVLYRQFEKHGGNRKSVLLPKYHQLDNHHESFGMHPSKSSFL